MDHKKNWESELIDPSEVRRRNYSCERCMRTIEMEVAKNKALCSQFFLDELAEYMQDESEDLVEDKHADEILHCTTDMDEDCKNLIRKMHKMSFEEDFQTK